MHIMSSFDAQAMLNEQVAALQTDGQDIADGRGSLPLLWSNVLILQYIFPVTLQWTYNAVVGNVLYMTFIPVVCIRVQHISSVNQTRISWQYDCSLFVSWCLAVYMAEILRCITPRYGRVSIWLHLFPHSGWQGYDESTSRWEMLDMFYLCQQPTITNSTRRSNLTYTDINRHTTE